MYAIMKNTWENITMIIGITGGSGSGKSTLTNKLNIKNQKLKLLCLNTLTK